MQWLHSIKDDFERSFSVIILGITNRQKNLNGYKKFNKRPIFKILCIKQIKSNIVLNFQVLKSKISQILNKKISI